MDEEGSISPPPSGESSPPPTPVNAPRAIPIANVLIALEQIRAFVGQIHPANRLVPLYFWDILFQVAVTTLSRANKPVSFTYTEVMSTALRTESFMVRDSPTQLEVSLRGEEEEDLSEGLVRKH